MPCLPNLASPKPEIYEKSVATLTAELSCGGHLPFSEYRGMGEKRGESPGVLMGGSPDIP